MLLININMVFVRVNGIKWIKLFLIVLMCGCFFILIVKGRSIFLSDVIILFIEKYF